MNDPLFNPFHQVGTQHDPAPAMADRDRAQLLARAVQDDVLAGGRIDMHSDLTAVVRFGNRTHHWLHAVLSVLTGGLWLLVWGAVAMINTLGRSTWVLNVDETGYVTRTRV